MGIDAEDRTICSRGICRLWPEWSNRDGGRCRVAKTLRSRRSQRNHKFERGNTRESRCSEVSGTLRSGRHEARELPGIHPTGSGSILWNQNLLTKTVAKLFSNKIGPCLLSEQSGP